MAKPIRQSEEIVSEFQSRRVSKFLSQTLLRLSAFARKIKNLALKLKTQNEKNKNSTSFLRNVW